MFPLQTSFSPFFPFPFACALSPPLLAVCVVPVVVVNLLLVSFKTLWLSSLSSPRVPLVLPFQLSSPVWDGCCCAPALHLRRSVVCKHVHITSEFVLPLYSLLVPVCSGLCYIFNKESDEGKCKMRVTYTCVLVTLAEALRTQHYWCAYALRCCFCVN